MSTSDKWHFIGGKRYGYLFNPDTRDVEWGDIDERKGAGFPPFVSIGPRYDPLYILPALLKRKLQMAGFSEIEHLMYTPDAAIIKCVFIGKTSVAQLRQFIPYREVK